LGIPTPAIDTMVSLAQLVIGTAYWDEGITAEKLGLGGMSAAQVVKYITTGEK
jgi:opine dehydrogenase